MIPIRSSERVYARPAVTASLIAANSLVFFYQLTLSNGALNAFVREWGLIPDQLRLATLFTSMFLHGGWLHLIGNMWFLWVFGRLIEDAMGSARFFGFYIGCGLAAAVTQVIANAYSPVPTIGASGAIAGVMGAYLVKFPKSYIDTIVPLFIFLTRFQIPAPFFLLYWFAIQFFAGIGSIGDTDYTGGGTAWFAHIGGFLAGMLLIRQFKDRRPPRWRAWYEEED